MWYAIYVPPRLTRVSLLLARALLLALLLLCYRLLDSFKFVPLFLRGGTRRRQLTNRLLVTQGAGHVMFDLSRVFRHVLFRNSGCYVVLSGDD